MQNTLYNLSASELVALNIPDDATVVICIRISDKDNRKYEVYHMLADVSPFIMLWSNGVPEDAFNKTARLIALNMSGLRLGARRVMSDSIYETIRIGDPEMANAAWVAHKFSTFYSRDFFDASIFSVYPVTRKPRA